MHGPEPAMSRTWPAPAAVLPALCALAARDSYATPMGHGPLDHALGQLAS